MSEEQWEIGEEQVRDCKAVAMVFDMEPEMGIREVYKKWIF